MLSNRVRRPRRYGTIVPFFALAIVAIFAFTALAIDMGVLVVARTDAQNAADTAALSGCRILDNRPASVNNNALNAVTASRDVLTQNQLLSNAITPGQIQQIRVGVYDYDSTPGLERFSIISYSANTVDATGNVTDPGADPSGKAWGAMEVTMNTTVPSFFSRVIGVSSLKAEARALAVHRPRDVAIVLDYSGSMKFATTFTWPNNSATTDAVGMMNPDPLYPQFGHYARYAAYRTVNPIIGDGTSTSNHPTARPNPLFMREAYVRTDTGEVTSPANLTAETMGGPPIVKDFSTSTLADGTTTPADSDLANAFHHWEPALLTALNINRGGTIPVVEPATFAYGSYPFYSDPTKVFPAPASFGFQSDVDEFGNTLPYLGDKHPRKYGATTGTGAFDSSTFWDPTDPDGPAMNVAELLGWSARYASGSSIPTVPYRRRTVTGSSNLQLNATYGPVGTGSTSTYDYNSDISGFRDATWERYGYDLDINNYVTNRNTASKYTGSTPKGWDPRWDYDLTASQWVHNRTKNTSGSYSLPPITDTEVRTIIQTSRKFQGYSMGPGYWGKTFFIWPPDPRFDPSGNPESPDPADPVKDTNGNWICDWRLRFFKREDGTKFNPQGDNLAGSGARDGVNEALFRNGNGCLFYSYDGSRWVINYTAVMQWLKHCGPSVFPSNLRSGRVLYYTSIPDSIPDSSRNDDEEFWKKYIDFVFGTTVDGGYNPYDNLAGTENRGWPEKINSASSYSTVNPSIFSNNMNGFGDGLNTDDPMPYMRYNDSPARPRMHLWFGPLTMIGFLMSKNPDRNFISGTAHEAQCWQLKAGIQSALEDMRNNHPNDWVGTTYFAGGGNNFGRRVLMGQNWTYLKNVLFFPYGQLNSSTGAVSGEWRIIRKSSFDTNTPGRTNIPNAEGGTDPGTGLMNAYNLLSNATALNPDGTGRRGATKIVILETDGVPNTIANGNFVSAGSQSYYNNVSPGSYYSNGSSTVINQALDVVDRIVAPVATSGASGFSLPSSPARVYPVAFGDLFDTPTATQRQSALDFLRDLGIRGNTLAGSATTMEPYQIITGDYQDRIDRLRDCLERIMQSGVQVTLIE